MALRRPFEDFGKCVEVLASGATGRFDQELGHAGDFFSCKNAPEAILSLEKPPNAGLGRTGEPHKPLASVERGAEKGLPLR